MVDSVQYELKITNPKIISFYQSNSHIDFESVNLLLIELLQNNTKPSLSTTEQIKSAIMYPNEQKINEQNMNEQQEELEIDISFFPANVFYKNIGIEYFLLKQPEKECKDLNECVLKEMPEPIPEKKVDRPNNNKIDDIQINPNIKKAIYPKISTLKMIIILILILISIFLIYYYLIK